MSTWGIVVAAGRGTRFGGAKHELELEGHPLWAWARDALLEAGADDVVLVGPVPGGVAGGVRRQDSVAAGLSAVPGSADIVAVHDAARPLAGPAMIARLIDLVRSGAADGVVPVIPVRDTIKRVQGDRIVATLDREGLVAAQTPQVFRASWLRRAHREVTGDATDDASMVESIGGSVITAPGEPAAMKITYPEDVVTALHHLEQRRRG